MTFNFLPKSGKHFPGRLLFLLALVVGVGAPPPCVKAQVESAERRVWTSATDRPIIVIEVESVQEGGTATDSGWVERTTPDGYTGESYYVWKGEGSWGPEARPYDYFSEYPKATLTYRFRIDEPERYFFKVRNYHRKEDGDNDVWISVNQGEWGKTYDHQVKSWSFDERGDWGARELEEGRHTIELAGRSPGFGIDRIVIFREDVPKRMWSDVHREEQFESMAPSSRE